ncbi:unnamed protein product [Pleuronectes platessa]|uniref:Uncharacterized protein n=1 Tax=Pleuronectes platessa TaxID=8262 RepID=A0A9N7YSU4_PLEPL|nr:unnamed protein product [Pleuronectes platessa]
MEDYILIWPLAPAGTDKHCGSNTTLAHSVSLSKRLRPVIARTGWRDKTPLQCGVLVNWFWLGAKSPHRHLFVSLPKTREETAFSQASHNASNSL